MKELKLLKVAKSYLRQAKARLEDAKDAYIEGNYPYAVRLSQECVEFSLKAVLKAVGIEYPFTLTSHAKAGFLSHPSTSP